MMNNLLSDRSVEINEFKLDCDIVQDLLPSYLEQKVSEQTRILIQEHLESCDTCKLAFEQMSDSFEDLLKVEKPQKRIFQSDRPKKHKLHYKRKTTMHIVVLSYIFLLISILCFLVIDLLVEYYF